MASKPLPQKLEECWPIEQRILAYLDQRGRRTHHQMVKDLANPESKIAQGRERGSNGFVNAHAANWTRRLRKEGLVLLEEHLVSYTNGRGERRSHISHDGYSVTRAGKAFLRDKER